MNEIRELNNSELPLNLTVQKKKNSKFEKGTSISLNLRPDKSESSYTQLKINENEEKRTLLELKNVFDSCDEADLDLDTEPFFLIEIHCKFKIIWELFMLLSIGYSAFWTPLNLCFRTHNQIYELIDMFIEIALILDIILSFYTQIELVSEEIVSSAKIITSSYLKGWFFLDLITCFPASFIQFFTPENHAFTYLRWFGLVRLLKIIKYPFLINKSIIDNERMDQYVKNLIFMIIFLHLSSCFFIYLGLEISGDLNWISDSNLNNKNTFGIYIASVYFHVSKILTIGFGGVEGISIYERIYSIFLYLIIIFLFPFILINTSKLFAEESPSDLAFLNKINIMDKAHQKYNFPKELKKSLIFLLKSENVKKFSLRPNFFEVLPANLKIQLNSYIYNNRLQEILFFENQTYEFILFTIPYLRHDYLNRGYSIYNIGEKVDEMFLIIDGRISLSLGKESSNLEIAILRQNNYFGDLFLFTNKISPFNCKVKSNNTEVFFINSNDFQFIKTKYPKNILSILESSSETLNFLNERKKNLIHLLNQEKTKEKVIYKLKDISAFLLERDFDKYFYDNYDVEGVNEFLVNNSYTEVKSFIENIRRKSRKLQTQMHPRVPNLFNNLIRNPEINLVSKKRDSYQENADFRKSENFKFSPVFSVSKIKKFDSIEKERFDKNVKKVLKLNTTLKELKRESTSKSKSKFSKENDSHKNKNNAAIVTVRFTGTKKINKKKILKSKFISLFKEIYKINFEQDLDLNSLKKEKAIESKINEIIKNNMQEKIVKSPESTMKQIERQIEYEFTTKSVRSFGKCLTEKRFNSGKGFQNLELHEIKESSFSFIHKNKKKNINSFSSLKHVKCHSFILNEVQNKYEYKIKSKNSKVSYAEKFEMDLFNIVNEEQSFKTKQFIMPNIKKQSKFAHKKIPKSTKNLPRENEYAIKKRFSNLNQQNTFKEQNKESLKIEEKIDRIINFLNL